MAWSNPEKKDYAFNGSYEVGVHIKEVLPGPDIGEDGLVKVCTAGSLEGISMVIEAARAYRDGMIKSGAEAFLRSPNIEIYGMHADVAQQKPKIIQKL